MIKSNNKQTKNNYTPVILSCAGALGFKTYLQIESARLGDNSGTIQLSQSTFFGFEVTPMNIGIAFMIISPIIFLLIYPMFNYFCHRIIKKMFFKENSAEKIILTCRSSLIVPIISYTVFGYFLGCYIVPFFIFPNIVHIDMVSHENLPLYILLSLVFLLFGLANHYNTIILTNKRIINSFIFFPPWTKSMFLSDIKTIQPINYAFAITSKTDKIIGVSCRNQKQANIFEQKLRAVLQKTRRIIDGYSDECNP